jgi:outer membrane receptor protein involved in Fe transport
VEAGLLSGSRAVINLPTKVHQPVSWSSRAGNLRDIPPGHVFFRGFDTMTFRAVLVASATLLSCLPAAAQTTAAAPDDGLAEIVVTAERRETRLQKTPISISVATAADLENRRVQSLADLADGAIPSLRIAPFFSRTSALTVGIRGSGSSVWPI